MDTSKVVYYIMAIAEPNNFYEVLVKCRHKFPEHSNDYLLEILREFYNLRDWANFKYTSTAARKLTKEARLSQWEKKLKEYYGEDE